jgi:MOSC domain-containing protein YiiM
MSTIAHIFVAEKRGGQMCAVASVEAVAEMGLRGDRYVEASARPSADYQVTLIELENIAAFTRKTGLELAPHMPRRNIVTVGVRLNDFVGKRFSVGKALFEGLELCEPCRLFAKRTHAAVLEFFPGKGGLRARIVSGGVIAIGDSVIPMPNSALLTDTSASPLRAQHGAANRER